MCKFVCILIIPLRPDLILNEVFNLNTIKQYYSNSFDLLFCHHKTSLAEPPMVATDAYCDNCNHVPFQMRTMSEELETHWKSWIGVWTSLRPYKHIAQCLTWHPAR